MNIDEARPQTLMSITAVGGDEYSDINYSLHCALCMCTSSERQAHEYSDSAWHIHSLAIYSPSA